MRRLVGSVCELTGMRNRAAGRVKALQRAQEKRKKSAVAPGLGALRPLCDQGRARQHDPGRGRDAGARVNAGTAPSKQRPGPAPHRTPRPPPARVPALHAPWLRTPPTRAVAKLTRSLNLVPRLRRARVGWRPREQPPLGAASSSLAHLAAFPSVGTSAACSTRLACVCVAPPLPSCSDACESHDRDEAARLLVFSGRAGRCAGARALGTSRRHCWCCRAAREGPSR